MTSYNNEKRYTRINLVLTVVVVFLLIVAITGVYKTIDSYEKYGVGALIDQQHQKYQQEKNVSQNTKPDLVRCDSDEYEPSKNIDCIADIEK